MPGYVIHLAVAKIYEQNNEIGNIEEFERGVIEPDMISKDKMISHYGPKSSKPGLNKYLEENKEFDDYKEGYFLHLLTDYLFYNKYLERWDPIIYEDYDKLNPYLIEKYGVELPEVIRDIVKCKDGDLNLINKESICKFIEAVGKIKVRDLIVKKNINFEEDFKLEL